MFASPAERVHRRLVLPPSSPGPSLPLSTGDFSSLMNRTSHPTFLMPLSPTQPPSFSASYLTPQIGTI